MQVFMHYLRILALITFIKDTAIYSIFKLPNTEKTKHIINSENKLYIVIETLSVMYLIVGLLNTASHLAILKKSL